MVEVKIRGPYFCQVFPCTGPADSVPGPSRTEGDTIRPTDLQFLAQKKGRNAGCRSAERERKTYESQYRWKRCLSGHRASCHVAVGSRHGESRAEELQGAARQ